MCFHSKQSKSAVQVENRFKAKIDVIDLFQPNDNINGFDFPLTPIITDKNPKIITHFNWGLIPTWSINDDIKKLTLNARIETLEEKSSFKNSINNRCLVIANDCYEWQWLDKKEKNKIKYEIGIGNDDLFAFAGLYSEWINKETGEVKHTYTIITTQANGIMSEIHNTKKRMPIILKPEDEQKWLQNEAVQNFAYPYQVHLVTNKCSNNLTLF